MAAVPTPTVARPDVSHYTYRLTWSAEDGEYLATCAEFPSLSWLASSQMDALQGLEDLLRDVIVDLEEQGEQVPQPFAERSYSGKFNLRVGESLHRELAIHAAEDGMSLNQYVLRKLTAASPPAPVGRRDAKDTQQARPEVPRPRRAPRP